MKPTIAFLITLHFSSYLFSQNQHKALEIYPLTGDFYIFTTYNTYKGEQVPANGMYVLTTQGAVLIDTPWDTTQFQPLLDSIQARHHQSVSMCIATHSHEDRTGGLDFLKMRGIRTYTSLKTDKISKTQGQKRSEFLIDQDTVFSMGAHTFQTYYSGPGHTPDNIIVWFDHEKVLYGGCLVKSVDATDLGNLNDANLEEWDDTIRRIQKKFPEPEYIIPGHGRWNSKKALKHTLKLLKRHSRNK